MVSNTVAFIFLISSYLYQIVRDFLIPLLVCGATPEASQALKFMATAMNTVRPN